MRNYGALQQIAPNGSAIQDDDAVRLATIPTCERGEIPSLGRVTNRSLTTSARLVFTDKRRTRALAGGASFSGRCTRYAEC